MGVWPGHSPIICALGDGVVRLNLRYVDGGGIMRVIVSGGYAEIENDTVIILADHACRVDEINPERAQGHLEEAEAKLVQLSAQDNRRAYWENRVKWFTMLLKYAKSAS